MLDAVAATGRATRVLAGQFFDLTRFAGAVLRSVSTYPRTAASTVARAIVSQVRFTAVEALPLTAVIAAAIGVVVIVEANAAAVALGVADTLARLMATVVVREAGPLMAAFMVLARSGTAIAAEVSTARVLGETDALEALGVNPLHYVVLPRLVGAAISVAVLTLFFNVIVLGTAGVTATTVLQQVSLERYVESLRLVLRPTDVWESLAKGAASGAMIAGCCTFAGLQARKNPSEIPRRVTDAMVFSLLGLVVITATAAVLRYR